MKKFYIHHHFTSLFILALLATFSTVLYYTEVVPAEANPALTPTPIPVTLSATPAAPVATGDTTGIVLWGFVIVAILVAGFLFSGRNISLTKK